MLNEIEKQNVSAAIFKFLAWSAVIVGAGLPLVHFVFHIQLELSKIAERLVNLI